MGKQKSGSGKSRKEGKFLGKGNKLGVSKSGPVNLLVVDDSAVVREVMSSLLTRKAGFHVLTAADPLIAMKKMTTFRPEVIVLDLGLPRMDGLTFLGKIMSEDPIPVVVCSALTAGGGREAIRAMEAGAVDVITKPRVEVGKFLNESSIFLMDSIRGAAQAKIHRTLPSPPLKKNSVDSIFSRRKFASPKGGGQERIVAIGTSTGGTEALRVLLGMMPQDAPGMVVVQHIPQGFTAAFAKRLNQLSEMQVQEAENGDRVEPGKVLIAPGNRHVTVVQRGKGFAVKLTDGPLINRRRPSVDVLFRSVAQNAGERAVGVVMTGVGNDGAEGLWEIREKGGFTLAQDEKSCVVFEMPKTAIRREGVDEVVELESLGDVILRWAWEDRKGLS